MVVSSPIIDSLEFSRQGKSLAGCVVVNDLPRLAESVANVEAALSWQLRGEKDEEGKLFLELAVEGVLSLICQRCLAEMALPVSVAERLLLVPDGAPWPEDELEDDSMDAIAAEREMSVLTLVEDEVLLALPVVPRHPDQAMCRSLVRVDEDLPASPFALLEQLKKKH